MAMSSAKSHVENTPIILVLGGYQSCPLSRELVVMPTAGTIAKMEPGITALKSDFERAHGQTPKFLFACYTGILRDMTLDRLELWISYQSNFGSKQVHKLRSSGIRDRSAISPLYRTVSDFVDPLSNPKIYIVGHSYGGWSAIQVAQELGDRGFHVSGLTTIDPINPVLCKPRALAGNILSSGSAPLGCLTAPSDFDSRIFQHVSWWRNFYQKQTTILHSDAIQQLEFYNPGTDRKSDFGNSLIRKNGNIDVHSALAHDENIWKWVASAIIRTYSR
jgi:pimeloyl-ACP methyl ester carboxylesterase